MIPTPRDSLHDTARRAAIVIALWLFLPAAVATAQLVSDDFNACALDPGLWTLIDPRGDASAAIAGAGSGDAKLLLSVPGGVAHDAWGSNDAVRLMQATPDVDFSVEAKFDSVVTQRYQEQGLLVEGGPGDWIRFDVFSDGSQTYVFAARFANGRGKVRFQQSIPSAAPIYLRLERVGSVWTGFHSFDGQTWQQSGSFNYRLAVGSVGVFAGNDGGNPAHTAEIDYFFNTASPIVGEDQGAVSSDLTLTVNTLGNGTVDVDPNQPSYTCNETVTLTPQPAATWAFSGWSGDATGSDSPLNLVMSGDKSVTATFDVITAPPAITGVQVGVTETTATIAWTTDQLADSSVAYGETTLYELGSVDDPALVTNHVAILTNLAPGTAYHAQITSVNELGIASSSGDLGFTTNFPPVTSGVESDDFNSCDLDTLRWTFTDPRGDSTVQVVGGGSGQAQLEITVPPGVSHDPWDTNTAAQLMQPAANADFEIEAKFDSPVTLAYQEQGLLVQESATDWVRFDVYSDGLETRLFGGTVVGGSGQNRLDVAVPSTFPIHLRLGRVGDEWTASHSFDGQTWVVDRVFTHAMLVNAVGIFAGNDGSSPPGHTAVIDYFQSSADPISGEDQGGIPTELTLTVETNGGGSVNVDPNQPDLLGAWGFDEPSGTTAVDSSGNGNAGLFENGAARSPNGYFGEALETDGVAGDLNLGGLDVDPNGLTVMAWINADDFGTSDARVLSKSTSSAEQDHLWMLSTISGPHLRFRLRTNGNTTTLVGSGGQLSAGTWIHAAATYDGSTMRIYQDGVEVGSVAKSGPIEADPAVDAWIAANPGKTKQVFDGRIDEVKIFRRALTPSEIQTEMATPITTYMCGDQLTLTPEADFGWFFTGWSGDSDSSESSLNVPMTENRTLTANFQPIAGPPTISDLALSYTASTATVTWTTNHASTSSVAYGLTTSYELGTSTDPVLVTDHAMTVTGLAPGTTHHLQVTSENELGYPASSADLVFTTPVPPPSAGIVSDDFNACALEPSVWTFVDPQLDSDATLVGGGTGDAQLHISVPAGVAHDPWQANVAARLMQSAVDGDLEIEAKFDSPVTEGFQEQGLMVESAAGDWLRFDVSSDGFSTLLFAGTVVGGVHQSHFFDPIPSVFPIYLRLRREGDVWTAMHSTDGVAWQTAGTFTRAMALATVGVFAGNDGSDPAHTAVIDYFSSTASPIVDEDAAAIPAQNTLTLSVTGNGQVIPSPDQSLYVCGQTVELSPLPDPTWYFTGWSGDLTGNDDPGTLVMNVDRDVTGNFDAITGPPTISDIQVINVTESTAVVEWRTDHPTTARVDFGETSGYELGFVEDSQLVTRHSVLLSGLSPVTPYHYKVSSENELSLTAASGDLVFITQPAGGPGGPLVQVWYGDDQRFGDNGLPQPFVNVLGNVLDADGVAALSYRLNGGPSVALNMGPDNQRLADPGDFNIDIPNVNLSEGANTVTITAVDGVGDSTVRTVVVNFDSTNVWPTAYTIDWSQVNLIDEVAQVVDGHWQLEGDSLRTIQVDYDRLVALGDPGWIDYQAIVPITIHGYSDGGFDPFSNRPGVGLLMRWGGHKPPGQPQRGFELGAIGFYRIGQTGNNKLEMWTHDTPTSPSVQRILNFGVSYVFKMEVETLATAHQYRLKVWEEGQPEPPNWDLVEDQPLSEISGGSLVLIAHHVDASFGTVTVTPLP